MVQPINVHDVGTPPPGVAPPSNISNMVAIVDDDFLGATVSFNIVALTNVTSMVLLRSFTNSVLAAKQLESVPLIIGSQNYDDRDPLIVGKQVWYWILMGSPQGYPTYVGDITLTVRKPAPAQAVNWVEASGNQGDSEEPDSVRVNIVCETVSGADVSGGIAVFVSGYQGNAGAVLIYQDTTETLSFLLKQTGERVTFQVATVNAAGVLSALSAGAMLALNGNPTKPCRLTGLSALEGNGVTQISFTAGLEPDITLYRLWRGPFGGGFSAAAVVATLVPTDEPEYSIQDKVVNGNTSTYHWYVTAFVNPFTESDASDAIYPVVPWA